MADEEGAAAGGGLLHSLRNFARTLLAAAQTRLEILATELEEERLRLEQLLALALAAAFCLGMGVLLSALFIVAYFWDSHRLEAIAILAGAFLAGGAALGWLLRSKARARGKPFAATRGEIARDRAALGDSSQGARDER
jgi:uncharacterized membrane protein YqjE